MVRTVEHLPKLFLGASVLRRVANMFWELNHTHERNKISNIDGTLEHDFVFVQTQRCLHVGNAPSPAATSALPIAAAIVAKL